ncbi:MAG: endonuclease/exonuclease/phosphatase family protein [Clostridia bacterium]|nr:endonuclease/exonuclease/phosphatase family protein [Clostridia bacterium]
MKFMSFNTQHCLNYLERRIDFDLMAKTIRELGADVVGLNEIRGAGTHPDYTAQTEALAERCGMKYYYFAKAIDFKDGPYGNAIISRVPIISAQTIKIPDPNPRGYKGYYETRCVLKATLEGGVTVLISHFGLNPDEQENAVRTVISNLAGERCVLMGDFNLPPDSQLLSPIRERMRDTAELFGEEKLSFPSDKPEMKIDYIFATPDLKVTSADIPAVVASDHRPHIAVVE